MDRSMYRTENPPSHSIVLLANKQRPRMRRLDQAQWANFRLADAALELATYLLQLTSRICEIKSH